MTNGYYEPTHQTNINRHCRRVAAAPYWSLWALQGRAQITELGTAQVSQAPPTPGDGPDNICIIWKSPWTLTDFLLQIKDWIWNLCLWMKRKQNLNASCYPFKLKYRIPAEIQVLLYPPFIASILFTSWHVKDPGVYHNACEEAKHH